MNILITGGFGYLGGRLAQYLDQAGHDIYLGTRLNSVSPAWLPQANVVQIDWGMSGQLDKICSQMDVVVHAAGMNAKDCLASPDAALAFNGGCTERLLHAAIRQQVKQFIYLSTAHVYASPLAGSITENTVLNNSHPYATSHRAGEACVLKALELNQIDGLVLRLSNAFGAPTGTHVNCWSLMTNDLCKQAVIGRKMILNSTGTQRRDFVPLTDVCQAIKHLLDLSAHEKKQFLYNIGGQWAPTLWEMACLIQARCEVTLGFCPSLSRILPQLEEPEISLEYQLDTLFATGFRLRADPTSEIDDLLLFCDEMFA